MGKTEQSPSKRVRIVLAIAVATVVAAVAPASGLAADWTWKVKPNADWTW